LHATRALREDSLRLAALLDERSHGSPYRWWGLAGGILWAVIDTFLAVALGISFTVDGRDATWLAVVYFGSSFAMLGWLAGYALEARHRIAEQTAALAATRARLAQSEKLAALGQLATAIAHEVRNPLAIMRSAAQGMVEGPTPPGESWRAPRRS
jgi:signal transduction histidine kinase